MTRLPLAAFLARTTRAALDAYHLADEPLEDPSVDAHTALGRIRTAMADLARYTSERLAQVAREAATAERPLPALSHLSKEDREAVSDVLHELVRAGIPLTASPSFLAWLAQLVFLADRATAEHGAYGETLANHPNEMYRVHRARILAPTPAATQASELS